MAAMGDDDEGGEEIDVDQAKRMEDLVLKWLSSENDSQRRDADGYTEASVFAGMRKARRMGFSEEMVLIVARKSESLEVDGKRIRKAEKERRQDDLRKMLEFWFGAGNLRRDKFLAQNLRESTDAMVSVDTILGFNKVPPQFLSPVCTPLISSSVHADHFSCDKLFDTDRSRQ